MFSIGLKIIPQAVPTTLTLQDDSSGDETVVSAVAVINKTDLVPLTFNFVSPFTLGEFSIDVGFLDRDYALNLVYTVVTNADTYTKTYQFVTLGYSNLIKKNREFLLENDKSIQDQEIFKKETLDINYYRMVAKDRCRFSDLVGAQKALDYIADINLNIDFTLCSTC